MSGHQRGVYVSSNLFDSQETKRRDVTSTAAASMSHQL